MSDSQLICICDDEQPLREMVSEYLEKNGFTTIQAHDAQSLRTVLEENTPDVILLDINMPELDGWEFLKSYRAYQDIGHFKARIYVVSSSINPHDMERAMRDPLVSEYLVKPVSQASQGYL